MSICNLFATIRSLVRPWPNEHLGDELRRPTEILMEGVLILSDREADEEHQRRQ